MAEILLGRTGDGSRVMVEIHLVPFTSTGLTTVSHTPVPDDTLRLAITGDVYERFCRIPCASGQIVDTLSSITSAGPYWTLDSIAELATVWRRWHLNDMRAGCEHQTTLVYEDSAYGKRIDLDATTAANPCPVNYKYGSAWLYEPLPDDVTAKVRSWLR